MDHLLTADAAELRAACQADLVAAAAARDGARALPDNAGFEDVLSAWDAIGHPLNRTAGLVHLFFQVHPQAEVRSAMAEMEQEISQFGTELSLDRGLYDRLSGLDPEAAPEALAGRIVEHALRDFRRAGVDQDEPARTRIRALREELVELSQTFARNIAGDVRTIRLDTVDELEGLPDDFIRSHPVGADGKIEITTNPPDVLPFLKFARNRDRRRELHRAYLSRAPDNMGVLDSILAARHELATLLGYSSWAAYVTEDKMIRTPEAVGEFIERISALTGERMAAEAVELLTALRAEQPGVEGLHDYDRAYATEKVRREQHAFDSRDVRPYLPYVAVRKGVFETTSRLYGVTIRRRQDVPLWHPDVEAYELLEDGEVIARFFLDMHPRDDKFKHAAMFDLSSGLAGRVLPAACLVCNMTRPTDDDPALLDPGDMRTFFHEFGHLMHHLLAGRHRWLATSGIATEWDFVEVPSQLFEEWSRDPGVLATFARHHETDEVIPAELVERMNRASDYGKGLQTRVQMFYASLSLEFYRRDPAQLDTTALLAELKQQFLPFPHEEGTLLQASFGHLDGYSALYYTYMWSLVLAKDCLSAFGDDLMDKAVAQRYRDCVLAPGGSRDATDLLESFLGRPSSFAAFEAWLAA